MVYLKFNQITVLADIAVRSSDLDEQAAELARAVAQLRVIQATSKK